MSSKEASPAQILLNLVRTASFQEESGSKERTAVSEEQLEAWCTGLNTFISFLRVGLHSPKVDEAISIVTKAVLVLRDENGDRLSTLQTLLAAPQDPFRFKIGVKPDRLELLCNIDDETLRRFCKQVQIGEPRFAEMVLLGL